MLERDSKVLHQPLHPSIVEVNLVGSDVLRTNTPRAWEPFPCYRVDVLDVSGDGGVPQSVTEPVAVLIGFTAPQRPTTVIRAPGKAAR